MNSSQMEPGELVSFQLVSQAYPTRHSWIITAHISLGNLECHWKLFNRQLTRTQQFLRSLDQHPSAPTQLTHYTPARVIQHTGHIQIQRDYYNLCHQSTELQPTADQHMMQKKLIAFPRNCPQLAHRNHHY